MKIAHRPVVVITLAILALTGCTAAPSVKQAAGHTAVADSAPSGSPTPTPTKPALSDLVVSPEGLGPLQILQPVPTTDAATAVVTYDPKLCLPSDGSVQVGAPGVGAWVPNYPQMNFGTSLGNIFTIYTQGDIQSGVIHDVWVWTPDIKTSTGISLGSTIAQLKSAYPTFSYVLPSDYVTLYVIDGGAGRMIFEVAKAVAGQSDFWKASEVGTVRVIHVQPSTVKAYAISGSSDGLHTCSPGGTVG